MVKGVIDLHVLAIPVSTVASKSAFSTGERVLDLYRCSITPQMVEALVCTQDWIKKTPSPLPSNENDEFLEFERIEEGSDGSHLEQEFEEGGNSTVNANHVIQNEENEIKFEMPQNLPTGEFKDLELLIDGEKMHNFTKKEYDIGDGFGHFGLVVDDAFGMELLRTQDDPESKVP
ncbi:hypothetical protein JHK85_051116 [Glycine max]|nr:hypothetical protein JHK85_051116 [Glycine max]